MKYFGCQTHDSFTSRSAFIVPIGSLDRSLLKNLVKVLDERFKIRFYIKEPLEIPKDAFNPRRGQFDPNKIFKILKRYEGKKVLGIIDQDLYAQGLNFIFGQAEPLGRCALVSITRLRQEFYGLPKDEMIFFNRIIKEAIHELGHTYGITHCSNKDCVMFFSNSIIDTDRKNSFFCKMCQEKLGL
ncbi:MAG: archaemetzincin family Zn-dependent metalloprotease [Candidatus Atribacteria bacterium]